MTALTQDRNTPRRDGDLFVLPVAAGAKIFAGSIVMLDEGYAVPGAAVSSYVIAGCAEEAVDNTDGADGDVSVTVRRGVFKFANGTGAEDKITIADIGDTCYVADDQTVATTNGMDNRPEAGVVVGVEPDGVWVRMGL